MSVRKLAKAPEPAGDTEAIARVARGDVGALGEIYDRHARPLLRFVARTSPASEAEDIVHTTFIRAARIASSYVATSDSARAWLFGIAVRVLQERRRSLARFARAVLRIETKERAHESLGARSDLEKGLRALTEAKRVVVVLAEVEGFTCAEIAAMLDLPLGTVWTRLHHARRELRAFLTEELP